MYGPRFFFKIIVIHISYRLMEGITPNFICEMLSYKLSWFNFDVMTLERMPWYFPVHPPPPDFLRWIAHNLMERISSNLIREIRFVHISVSSILVFLLNCVSSQHFENKKKNTWLILLAIYDMELYEALRLSALLSKIKLN